MTQDEVIAPVGSVANLTIQQGRVAFTAVILPDGIYGLYTADQLAAAVLRERKECAKVCEAEGVDTGTENELETDWWLATRNCAQAIRARGNT